MNTTEISNVKQNTGIKSFGEGFNNLTEALEFATIVSKTDFAPKEMKGKPNDILLAMQMGAEIGLKPMQAIQNISVINGRPSVWGDAALAVVKNHKDFEYCNEYLEENNTVAICEIKRKNEPLKKIKFSTKDAQRAGLLSDRTNGFSPWKKYPERMLQMRARGFALRDSFPDALKGLVTSEEAQDYQTQDTNNNKVYDHKEIQEEIVDVEEEHMEEEHMAELASEDQLRQFYDLCIELKIDNELKKKWLNKAQVSTINEMKYSDMQKLLNHLIDKCKE